MENEIKLNVEEMTQAGMSFGHKISNLHPKMKPYVSGIKNSVNIIDLEKTAKDFEKALKFISRLVFENKTILFVGTKIQVRNLVKATAEECGFPYVTERWLGGTITNFETISKKERLMFGKEMESLRVKFEGIKDMTKLPDAVFIFDLKKDETCAREAKRKGIEIVGIVDTNINPEMANYPIPANDDAISSVKYILDKVKECIMEAKQSK